MQHYLFHILVTVGVFGLVASFNGIILAAGRATYEFGKGGFAPQYLGTIHKRFKTPALALLSNMIIGIFALSTGKTAELIIMACFGALTLYIIAMISLIHLRTNNFNKSIGPFAVPFYPYSPWIALIIATISLIAMTIANPILALIYFGIVGVCFGLFCLLSLNKLSYVKQASHKIEA